MIQWYIIRFYSDISPEDRGKYTCRVTHIVAGRSSWSDWKYCDVELLVDQRGGIAHLADSCCSAPQTPAITV